MKTIQKMEDLFFSYYKNGITQTRPTKEINLLDLYNMIIDKKDSRVKLCQEVQKRKEKKFKNQLKKRLDYITPAGIFNNRSIEGLKKPSGLAPIDIDDLKEDEITEILSKVREDPFVSLCFISPSKKGLKIIIRIPICNAKKYEIIVSNFYGYLHSKYNIKNEKLDIATKDISRACFLAYDSEAYLNENAEIFKDEKEKVHNKKEKNISIKDKSRSAIEMTEIIKLMSKNLSKEEVYSRMNLYSKWATSSDQYKEKTYSKSEEYIQSHPVPLSSTPTHPVPPSSTHEEYLIREIPKVNQIKTGIHKNIFYFATIVCDKNEEKKEAIITSNLKKQKYLYAKDPLNKRNPNDIKNNFGLNTRYPFEFDVLDNHISLKGKKNILNSHKSYTLKEVFDLVVNQNKKYMYYNDEIVHSIIALDILTSYFLPCFQAIGRTFLEAEKGSGKTRQCTIYKNLGFNTIMSADISGSAYYRLMESTCGLLIIDDFDSIGEDQKNMILQHYKTGYKNNSKSVRTGEGKSRKSDAFRNYGHCVMNNTQGLDDISADRSRFIPIVKATGKLTLKNIKEDDPLWQEITDKLYHLALDYWSEVKESYDNLGSSKLSGRNFEINRPILSLADLLDPKLKEEIENFFLEESEQKNMKDPSEEFDFILFEIFYNKNEKFTLPSKDISEIIREKSGSDWKPRGIGTFIGKKINTLGSIFRKKFIHGIHYIELKNKIAFNKYLAQKGWDVVLLGSTECDHNTVHTNEEKILNSYDLIKLNDNGKGVNVNHMANLNGISLSKQQEEFKTLSKNGEIYEVSSGNYKVME